MKGSIVRRQTGRKWIKLGIVSVIMLALLGGASGSSAQLPPIVPDESKSSPCPPTSGRLFCVDLTTYDGFSRNGGVEVDVQLENWSGSSLTNPSVALVSSAIGTGAANLEFVGSSPSLCSATANGAACSFPNLVGVARGATSPTKSAFVRLYFAIDADPLVTGVRFTATGNAKESGNDSSGAANEETRSVTGDMTFGTDPASSATIALGGDVSLSGLHNASQSSLDFSVPPGSTPFLARFAADPGPTECFGGISCTGLELSTDLSGAPAGAFSSSNQILWTSIVDAVNTNLVAIHYYDPVAVTATPPSTLTSTAGLSSCDGVTFATAPAGLSPNVDYYVVKASGASFGIATRASGKPLSFTGSGSFSASCIRIIGDQKSEQATSCTTPPSSTPALHAAKISSSAVRVCLWDRGNGRIHY
jgi:hypothetical protein